MVLPYAPLMRRGMRRQTGHPWLHIATPGVKTNGFTLCAAYAPGYAPTRTPVSRVTISPIAAVPTRAEQCCPGGRSRAVLLW